MEFLEFSWSFLSSNFLCLPTNLLCFSYRNYSNFVVKMEGNHSYKRWDSIIKSEQDKRSYRGLLLDNGMKILLISDPGTDKSAAAMQVNVGKTG